MYHIRYRLCKPAASAPRLIVAARYAPPPRRLINKYAAGITNIDSSGAVILPPTIGAAMRSAVYV